MTTEPKIKRGFILAAGKGERMRPLTDTCPKPLLEVGGCTMLDRAIDALEGAGVTEIVINAYYLADQIEAHVNARASKARLIVSREDELLDTGGGVKKALAYFKDEPFFVLNGDVVWADGSKNALTRMMDAWDGEKMDMMLMLHPHARVNDPDLKPDYSVDANGTPVRKVRNPEAADMVFAGPRIIKPQMFDGTPDGAFGFLSLMDKAELSGRLAAIVHDGNWYHVGTPAMLDATNDVFNTQDDALKKKQSTVAKSSIQLSGRAPRP